MSLPACPPCPKCKENYTYQDGDLLICPMCGFEAQQQAWQAGETEAASEQVIKDAVGNVLQDGDSVTVIKDLKVKAQAPPLKLAPKSNPFACSMMRPMIMILIVKLTVLAR